MAHTCSPSTLEAEMGGSLQVQGLHGPHKELDFLGYITRPCLKKQQDIDSERIKNMSKNASNLANPKSAVKCRATEGCRSDRKSAEGMPASSLSTLGSNPHLHLLSIRPDNAHSYFPELCCFYLSLNEKEFLYCGLLMSMSKIRGNH